MTAIYYHHTFAEKIHVGKEEFSTVQTLQDSDSSDC